MQGLAAMLPNIANPDVGLPVTDMTGSRDFTISN
jgi:hypothetical protein